MLVTVACIIFSFASIVNCADFTSFLAKASREVFLGLFHKAYSASADIGYGSPLLKDDVSRSSIKNKNKTKQNTTTPPPYFTLRRTFAEMFVGI